MSEERRQTRIVYDAFCEVAANGKELIRPGDVIEYLREKDQPLGIWYINGEFTRLTALGLISLDKATAQWRLEPSKEFDEVVSSVNGDWDALP